MERAGFINTTPPPPREKNSRLIPTRWARAIEHELEFPLGGICGLERKAIRLALHHGSNKGVIKGSVVGVNPLIASPETLQV